MKESKRIGEIENPPFEALAQHVGMTKENFLRIPTEYSKNVIVKLTDNIQGHFWRREKEDDIIVGEEYYIGPNQVEGLTKPEAVFVKIIEEKNK